MLIDVDGYVKICDFGFAKKAAASRTFTKCGTDEYAPPEVVSGRGRSCAADWWALGILLHEMLTGRPPFEGASAEEVFRSISEFSQGGAAAADSLQEQLLRTAEQISDDCAAFLMGLLKAREAERIGAGPAGFIQIQKHNWFDGCDWEGTLRRRVPAPWVPPPAPDGAVDVHIDFAKEDVRNCAPRTPLATYLVLPCTPLPCFSHLLYALPNAPHTHKQVMLDRPYDVERWAETFAEFGPYRQTKWPFDM